MPILEIGGRRVEVGPEFLSLSPEEQAVEASEIEASFGEPAEPQQGPGTGFGEFAQREAMEPETPELRREIDRSKAVAGYNAQPWYGREMTDLGDAVRLAATGATFGGTDWLSSLAGGGTLEEERAKTQAARDRQSWLGTAVEAAGSIASIPGKGIGLIRNIPAITSASGTGARVANTAARTGAFAAEGAALGAAGAVGYGNDVGTGAALGAALGPVGQAVGAAAGKVGNLVGSKPALIGPDAIADAGRKAYEKSEKAGLIIKPSWTNELAKDIREGLTEWGWHPKLTSKPMAVIDTLDELLTQNVTLKGVDTLRRIASNIGSDPQNRVEAALATQIVKKVDKHLNKLDDSQVLMGNKTEGLGALQDARRLWHTARKSEVVEEAVNRAKLNTAVTGTGGNYDNVLRQQFRNILNSPKKRRGFTTDELDAMRQVAVGTPSQSALRLLGRLSPTTGGLSLSLHGGALLGSGGLSAVAGAGGWAAKRSAEKMTENNVYGLARLIRENGLTPHLAAQVKKMPRARRQRLNRVLQGWNVTGAEAE
jgi:hypothetical protein